MIDKEVLMKLMALNGVQEQLDKLTEECGEFIAARNKLRLAINKKHTSYRNLVKTDNPIFWAKNQKEKMNELISEIADIYILASQFALLYPKEFQKQIEIKQERMLDYINFQEEK